MSSEESGENIVPSLDIRYDYLNGTDPNIKIVNNSYLYYNSGQAGYYYEDKYRTFINFGLIGQEKEIEKGKIYCFGIKAATSSSTSINIKIGKGTLDDKGNYIIEDDNNIAFETRDFYSAGDWEHLRDP
jgi:hypothetical protein